MLGAVIGDLAAWTWENEHEKFYPELISDKAQLSEYGMMLNEVSSLLMRNPKITHETFALSVLQKGWNVKHTVLRAIVIGWIADDLREVNGLCHEYALNDDKEDWYASYFVALLITALRSGATKTQAVEVYHVGQFENFLEGGQWEQGGDNSMLGYLVRVWKAFASSFDFGSAIHNAVKLPGDIHFNCILAGAFADAMYGHERYIIKKKFGQGCLLDLSKWVLPDVERYYSTRRTFYLKNMADTNVERHHYRNVVNPFAFIKLETGEYGKILQACEPSMARPYGLYLDDGWIYIYRESGIFGRFDFAPLGDGRRINNLQSTDDEPYWALLDGMIEAIECCGCKSANKLKDVSSAAALFVCFQGEDDCPKQWQGDLKADFWRIERMFLETSQSIAHWCAEAQSFKQANAGQLPEKVNAASDARLGIALYIVSLLSKWDPYRDTYYLSYYLSLQ